jgi:phage/plasmid-associated DNA primase
VTKFDLLLSTASEDREKIEKQKADVIKTYTTYYKHGTESTFSGQLIKFLKELLFDADFPSTLDINYYELVYKNGIVNLNTLEFRSGLKCSDYLTKTIPFDYKPVSEVDVIRVKEELKKICNYNDEHLDFYLSALGYSLTGDASRKQEFYSLIGQKANNGKSVIFEALTKIMPNYVSKFGNDIFDKTNSTKHKTIDGFRGLRIGWVNELTTELKDASFLKDVSDGNVIMYKKLFANETPMPVTFKTFLVGNHTLVVDADHGVSRRFRTMQMDSDFIPDLEKDDYALKPPRDYDKKPEICSPQKLPCFSYSTEEELYSLMSRLVVNNKPTDEYMNMLFEQRDWLLKYGTTESRALSIIKTMIKYKN